MQEQEIIENLDYVNNLDLHIQQNREKLLYTYKEVLDINWMETKKHILQLFNNKNIVSGTLTRKKLASFLNVNMYTLKKWLNTHSDKNIPYNRIFYISFILNKPLHEIIIYNIDLINVYLQETYLQNMKNILENIHKILNGKYNSETEEYEFIYLSQMIYNYLSYKTEYFQNTNYILCSLPLLDINDFITLWPKVMFQSVSKSTDYYISDIIFNLNFIYSNNSFKMTYLKHVSKHNKTTLIAHDDNIWTEKYKIKLNHFKTINHFEPFIKYAYFNNQLMNIKQKIHKSNTKYVIKKTSHITIQHTIDNSNELFHINWEVTKKNIKRIWKSIYQGYQNNKTHNHIQYISKILDHCDTTLKRWFYAKNDTHNESHVILYKIISVLGIPSTDVIVYNYECPEYQNAFIEFKYKMKKSKCDNNVNTLNQLIYKNIITNENNYTISEVLGFLPLVSELDLIRILKTYKSEYCLQFDTHKIVDKIIYLAKKSKNTLAKEFYFQFIDYYHNNKLIKYENSDPMTTFLYHNPHLKNGAYEYAELSYKLQQFKLDHYPKRYVDKVAKIFSPL